MAQCFRRGLYISEKLHEQWKRRQADYVSTTQPSVERWNDLPGFDRDRLRHRVFARPVARHGVAEDRVLIVWRCSRLRELRADDLQDRRRRIMVRVRFGYDAKRAAQR